MQRHPTRTNKMETNAQIEAPRVGEILYSPPLRDLRYEERNGIWTDNTRNAKIKGALYIIWCGMNRLDDSGVKVV